MKKILNKDEDSEILEDIDCLLAKPSRWQYSNLGENWQYNSQDSISLTKYKTGYILKVNNIDFILPEEYQDKIKRMIELNLNKDKERSLAKAKSILRVNTKRIKDKTNV